MKTGAHLKKRQGGAVAVMVGVSMLLLVGFLALVMDLGHLYIAKTELQNAADAAALAGAKQLNGKLLGINDPGSGNGAVQLAIATAAQNRYDFVSKPVDITISDIWVGNCPDDSCMVPASTITTDDAAANKFIIKVHTRDRTLDAWFAPIWNIMTTGTFGMAVAGRANVSVTPMAICAIDVSQCPCLAGETGCGNGSQQCGYEQGKAYHTAGINPIGPGTPIWIDAAANSASTCAGSTKDSRPFVCRGESFFATTPGSVVYTNTGLAAGPLFASLDSRFGDYASSGQCNPVTAPPDSNIREYAYQLFDDVGPAISGKNPYKGQPLTRDWLTPRPNPNPGTGETPQVSGCTQTGTDKYGGAVYNCPWGPNGVYWSASRPVTAVSGVDVVSTVYPASGTPYTQTAGDTYASGGGGQLPGRRLLNLTIVQCEAVGGECRPARIRMIGKYLLQTRASVSNDVNLEYIRPVSQAELQGEVTLYR